MDREKIGHVLINLISNAIKHSPKGSHVDIHVSEEKNKIARISVTDQGIGIDKKDHQKIFERFYRVEGKKETHFLGFGIGLFLAHSIVDRHNGKIEIQSEPGKGSTFSFLLPLG